MAIRLEAIRPVRVPAAQNGAAVSRLLGQGRGRATLLVAPERVHVRKVALGHLGDVLAAKDAHLEVHIGPGGQFGAAGFQVVEVLVDDFLGADVLCNLEAVAFVSDELIGGGQVDTAGERTC